MIRRYYFFAVAFAVGIGLGLPLAASDQVADPGPVRPLSFQPLPNVALLATNSIIVENAQLAATMVSGDIIVNVPSTGPTLASGTDLDIARGVSVSGDIYAESAVLNRNSTVSGVAFVSDLTLNTGAQVTGGLDEYVAPVIDPLPSLAIADIRDGAMPLNVPVDGMGSLEAGESYTDVTIEKGGTLVLSCDSNEAVAVFHMVSLTAGESSEITYGCPVDVRVQGRVFIGKNSAVFSTNPALDGSAAIFSVEGGNAVPDNPYGAPLAVDVGKDSTIVANVHAPNGTIRYNKAVDSSGMLLGRDIWLNGPFITESAFLNLPPVADPQTVVTNGDQELEIIVTGSDPEGGELIFSIAVGPLQGLIVSIDPIVPAPVVRDGVTTQPPVTSARVVYQPNTNQNLEDAFTFQVEDDAGNTGLAVVTINPSDPSPPAPGLDAVEAENVEVDVVVDSTTEITLDAGGPDNVTLAYAIESLPSDGGLRDSQGNAIETVPYPLPDATVLYDAPGTPGNVQFDYLARDTTVSPPCGSPDCAGATVFIGIDRQVELAEDQTVETDVNVPVLFTLSGNPGGTGTPQIKRLKALPGADIAGNVSDANGDGLGDGRDDLPGPAPVLIAAGVDINLGASGSVTDPAGDATNSPSDDPANPDLVSASAASDGTNLSLSVRFVESGFSAATSRGSFVIDIDENPATGFPGIDAANNDSALMGIEYLVNIGANLGQTADVIRYDNPGFTTVANVPATVLSDGYDVTIPLATLGGDDGRLTFKAETQSLISPTPGFTGILDYAPDVGLPPGQVSAGIQGVARVQIEWNIDGLDIVSSEEIESAKVTLNTEKGTVDDLDTMFFLGTEDQDGVLSVGDFETEAAEIDGLVMPVPDVPTGTQGTFTFDVTGELKSAVDSGFGYFTIQGRVDEQLAGGGFRRGLQIRSTANGNLTAGTEPQLDIVVNPDTGLGLLWTIKSLPLGGTVKTLSGTPLFVGQTFFEKPTLVYAAPSQSGTFTLGYEVTQGTLVDSATVNFGVLFNDQCVPVGRPPGCLPQ